MDSTHFLGAFSDGFSLWGAINDIAPFGALLGFGVAIFLTRVLWNMIKQVM